MANTTSTKGGVMAQRQQQQGALQKAAPIALTSMVKDVNVKKKFEDMLGKKAPGFISSMLSVVSNNDLLKKADPRTILAAAATAAALDLPINPTLGQAYIVPYKGQAQFQIGYRGIIALAQRSGKMKSIVMTPVYEGEIRDWNRFTETYTPGERLPGDNVVGYYARFELINGFAKATYWTKEEVIAHALKYSAQCKAAKRLVGVWASNFDQMACKTVLLSILKTYAPLSLEMEEGLTKDETVGTLNDNGDLDYVDVDIDNTDDSGSDNNAAFSDAAADLGEGPGVDGELFK